MPLDFPASPVDGQVYGNWQYSTSKGAWKARPMTGPKTVNSDTAPASPQAGDQWFNTTTGVLYIWVVDVDSAQWVESTAPISANGYYSPNYIINGGFDIWQRGTSAFTGTAGAGIYSADRWRIGHDGSGALTGIQQVMSPATISGVNESGYYYRVNSTVAASSGNMFLTTRLEDARTLAGQAVTLSFWAKSASAITYTPALLQDFGSGGSVATVTYFAPITLSTSWTRYSITTIVPSVSGKTINAGSYLAVYPVLFTTVNTIDIWGVQLEAGSTATPFRRNANSLQGELAACQRYYIRIYSPSTASVALIHGFQNLTTSGEGTISLPVTMRAVPSGSASNCTWSDDVTFANALNSFSIIAGSDQTMLKFACSFASAGAQFRPGQVRGNGSGYIELNSEL